jgi:uncharacterized protein (TIGR03083 family)
MTAALPQLRIELAPAVDALAATGRRLVELLRQIPDPAVPTRGLEWSLGELAAHLGARLGLFAGYVSGNAAPEGELADLAARNDREIRQLRQVPFETHVELVAASVAAFVEATKGRLGTDPFPWYSGIQIDVATGTGLALAEALVHGHDVARTIGRPWPISPQDARTIAKAALPLAPHYVDPVATRGVHTTTRLLIRGGPHVRIRVDDGTAVLEPPDGPADCTIRAHPVAFVLVSFGRRSQWGAAATGGLLVSGRRPWKALAFPRFFRRP